MYLLDTDICIYISKRNPPEVSKRFASMVPGEIGISTISLAELQYGVEKSLNQHRNQMGIDLILRPLEIFPFDQGASIRYGKLRVALEKSGKPIGGMDLLIAAHALELSAILVTNNIREFSRVPGLKIENWVSRK